MFFFLFLVLTKRSLRFASPAGPCVSLGSCAGPSDGVYHGQDAWDAQQRRLDEIDKLFPDRYIPLFQYRPAARTLRGGSVPPLGSARARSSSPFRRSTSPPPPIRSWTPPPMPSERVPRFPYAGESSHLRAARRWRYSGRRPGAHSSEAGGLPSALQAPCSRQSARWPPLRCVPRGRRATL